MKVIPKTLEEKINLLQHNSYFSTLPLDPLNELANATGLSFYSKGEVVFLEGEPSRGLYILERGTVKLFRVSLYGREIIVNILSGCATFNEVPVFDCGNNPVNVAALEDSFIWIVSGRTIREKLVEYPQFNQAVIRNLTQNLRMLVNLVDQLSLHPVNERLVRMLLQHSQEGWIEYENQDQLASRLGTVREVIARSIRELEKSGAIKVSKRRIEILNTQVLEEWLQPLKN